MWSSLKLKQRCVIAVNGFYEWLGSKSPKTPYYITSVDELLLYFAGLFDRVVIDGVEQYTFTIVTTDSSEEIAWLHHRMPVILSSQQDINLWLDPSSGFTQQVSDLIKPLKSGLKL